MFYGVSKIFLFLFQPSSLIVFILLLGVMLCFTQHWAPAGRRLGLVGALMLLVGGFSPLANWLILPLEAYAARQDIRHQAGGADNTDADRMVSRLRAENIKGIIILGGAESGRISLARGGLALNEAAERITEAMLLALKLPDTHIIFTGGAGQLFREEKSGAPMVARFLIAAGIDPARIKLEENSRNTFENAILTKALVQPKPGERWLLVTSAFHMPRSVGCFRKAGFEVLPWPVDYRTKGADDLLRPFNSIANGFKRLDVAVKEWIGLVVYRLTGRTDEIMPN